MGEMFKFSTALNKEESTASFIPYSSHITNSIIKLVSGDYLQVIKLVGAAYESADTQDINSWHDQLNGFMRNIASPNVAIWSHVVRRKYNEYPGGEFPSGFCTHLNEKYKKHILTQSMLVNELYLTIVYRPHPNKTSKMFDLFSKKNQTELEQEQFSAIETINDLSSTALAALDRYDPEILSCYEYNGLLFSETLEFLSFIVNGEWQRFPLPRNEIRNILCTSRPIFGKGGLMCLKGPSRSQYSAFLVFQEYPSKTCPGILNDLLSLPTEFVLTQSFTFLSKPVAVGRMKRQQSRMINAGDVSTSQIDEIDDAMDHLISNQFVMGSHHLSLQIASDTQKKLNDYISEAGSVLSNNGIKWGREELGIAGCYWSQLPGNFSYRVRTGDITSRNFAGFSSFHNYPIGRIRHNQWGDAVTVLKTTSGSPFYFNFHKGEEGLEAKQLAKLDPNHKDLANTVVIGKSGTGKTVLEMMLLAQIQKFNQPEKNKPLTSVLFDKDLGASVGVRAMGGKYYPLKNGVQSGFNPFQLEPTPKNLTFLERLIKQLVKREGLAVTPKQEHQINHAITGVMSVSKNKRRLSAVLEFLDPTEENGLYTRLSRWCQGGSLSWLFDNPEDTLSLDSSPIIGFDVTDFLDNDETRTPTIMYLFHRIESLIDGRRMAIFMDEFQRLLNDSAFNELVENKLVTIRKQDGFIVAFCQAPQQILRNPIAYAIVSQTATKIFLPNPEADYDDYVNGFKLSEREFEIIKQLGEKSRMFLIKQGQNSVVAKLDLKGFEDEIAVLSGNTATSLLVENLVKELGEKPENWLSEFHRLRK